MAHFPGEGGGGEEGDGGGLNLPVPVRKLFFGDVSDIRETLMEYVRPFPTAHPVVLARVPGDARTYLKRSKRPRRATAAIVAWFCDFHDMGYVLVGDFSHEDFGVDYLGQIRGRMRLLSLVRESATILNGVRNNMRSVAGIIHTHIHSQLQIPGDLTHLLNRLRNYEIKFSPLVRNHASHEEEVIKSALFIRLHSCLKSFEKLKARVYARILQSIQQIPDSSVWLGNALLNNHLLVVLRYAPGKGQATNLSTLVSELLKSKVRYVEDADGLLTRRRNGQAHMEADSSVDTLGYVEAALFGAAAGLRAYHQLQYNIEVAAAAAAAAAAAGGGGGAVQQQQSVDSLATRLLNPVSHVMATATGHAIERFLLGAKLSLDAAKVGAAAAANFVAAHEGMIQWKLVQDAAAAARVAAQTLQGGVAQGQHPTKMFNAIDIDVMYHLAAPRLLVGFQTIMFLEGECFRLSEDTKVPRLIP